MNYKEVGRILLPRKSVLDEAGAAGYTDGMSVTLREFTIADYEAAYSLWQSMEGIGLSEADEKRNIIQFLARNPGLSFVAEEDGMLVGAVLGGSDGRRGFLHHLAVAHSHRRAGIGRALVERSLAALADLGMRKCHIFVLAKNRAGRRFWRRIGWQERTTLLVMSQDVIARRAPAN
ncbi:MAG: GNAT family N-acetyltransferase [Spirochaetia bacterium]|jgi:ribosomal protein S18 acetylase RimI-like enzyme